MKKSILIIKSLFVIGALSIFSCDTDDGIKCPDPLIGELSAIETEFSGSWIYVAMDADEEIDITDDNTNNPSTDLFAQLDDCERDMVYNFMSNRNYEFKQGYLADDCNNPQTLVGTWSLIGSELTIVGSCSSQRIPIETNDEGTQFSYDTLLSIRDVNGLEKRLNITFTYQKGAVDQPEITPNI